MNLTPEQSETLTDIADLLGRMLTMQAEGPRPGSGYTNPRVIECALWDTCDSGGESVDSFDYKAGDVELPIALIRAAVPPQGTRAIEPEPVPLFGQPEALLFFLENAGAGCISGDVSEWPQLRRACRWAAEQIKATASATLTPLERFGLTMLEEHRNEITDLDGGFIQDTAERLGLLASVPVTESCGEHCKCAEYGDFPQDCLRETDAIRDKMAAHRRDGYVHSSHAEEKP